LSLIQHHHDRSIEAKTLNNLGYLYSSLGEKAKALEYYQQSLALNRELGDRTGLIVIFNNLGHLYVSLANNQKALDSYNQSLYFSRQLGDRFNEAITLYNIALLNSDRGNIDEAIAQLEAALTILEKKDNKENNRAIVSKSLLDLQQSYYQFYRDSLKLK
jgi:tetratricopeptide (TPR) repeat protein